MADTEEFTVPLSVFLAGAEKPTPPKPNRDSWLLPKIEVKMSIEYYALDFDEFVEAHGDQEYYKVGVLDRWLLAKDPD